jgi:hypothetical protein
VTVNGRPLLCFLFDILASDETAQFFPLKKVVAIVRWWLLLFADANISTHLAPQLSLCCCAVL